MEDEYLFDCGPIEEAVKEDSLSKLEKITYLLFTRDILGNITSCEKDKCQLKAFKKVFRDNTVDENHEHRYYWRIYGKCPKCGDEKTIIPFSNTVAGRRPGLLDWVESYGIYPNDDA